MISLSVVSKRAHTALAAAILAALLLFALADSASAAPSAVRYASPTGTGPTATCPEADPCDLLDAVAAEETPLGAEVILASGTYNLTDDYFEIGLQLDVHGTGAAADTRLILPPSPMAMDRITVSNDASLKNVYIEGANGVYVNYGEIENVIVLATDSFACSARESASFVNTVCAATASESVGLLISDADTVSLHNVSAVSTGTSGVGIKCNQNDGMSLNLTARNTIARGTSYDIVGETSESGMDECNFSMQYSSYDPSHVLLNPYSAIINGGGNQSAPPLFEDAAAGDLHQAAGSPTINAGTPDADSEPSDIDGDARTSGAAIDIGADEFLEAPDPTPVPTPDPPAGTTPPADKTPPETTILSGPAGRTRSHTAKFSFGASEAGATFSCQLDRGDWKPCDSSTSFKVKPGYHKLRVRATDAAGNTDPAHAHRTWRVLRSR